MGTPAFLTDPNGNLQAYYVNPDGSIETNLVNGGVIAGAPTAQFFVDSTGNTWALSVLADGSLQTSLVNGQPGTNAASLLASDIIQAVVQDAQVGSTNRVAILDYLNRVCQRILRESQWVFLRSQPKKFITVPGVMDYWIGGGQAPAGTVNTGLSLTDVWNVWVESVWDRTSRRQLTPNMDGTRDSSYLSLPDGQARSSYPREFRYEINRPNILSIFPPSDGRPGYQPVPLAPFVTMNAGGTLGNRILYVAATFVDSAGNESVTSSVPTEVFVPAGFLLTANSPAQEVASATQVNYNSWNCYIGTSVNSLTLQNNSPIAVGSSFAEASSGTISGAAPPTLNSLTPLLGYVIEFRYYQQRQIITSSAQSLQIPANYRDVVIAGVNQFFEMYMRKPAAEDGLPRASYWKGEFLDGIRQIRKDLNLNYRNTDFMSPDRAIQGVGNNTESGWFLPR